MSKQNVSIEFHYREKLVAVKPRPNILPGVLLSLALAAVASLMGGYIPLIGGPVFGVIIGIIANNLWTIPDAFRPGIIFTSKKILQAAIVVLGAGMSLGQVWQTGIDSLHVMLFTISSAFIATYLFGSLMGVPFNLKTLVGTGTAICGASAIAAITPVVKADDNEVAYAISTVFLFNIIAVLLFPLLGHLLGFSDTAFGLLAGTAINDTSSVVAAGYAFSPAAGAYATIVKLTRTTMIIPIALILSLVLRNRHVGKGTTFNVVNIIPWFVIWFLVAALLNTAGLFTAPMISWFNSTGHFLIVVALVAVGLGADLKKMLATGLKPLLLGLIVWVVVIVTSIVVQVLTGKI
ncbi:YeiH family protein [Neomoorella mulderi]|uniref:Sulfate exporter family transporter n=1 Tax=Moorella mulderi DSM 14980 TaxID=1122241 RepID=A0A151AXE7_9FIRM|nr:putative sulfate exporter family transporter [Moorella mulderi]KYH32326.1 hypothetical protein MOMUL_15480 [Moorella mulderi DSM 14980]